MTARVTLINASRQLCLVVVLSVLAACQPPPIDALLAEASRHEQKGDLQAAVNILKAALQREPQNSEVRVLLGKIFRQNGEPRGAEHHFREALNARHDPMVVLPLLAQSLFEQAEFKKVLDSTRSITYGEAALQPEVLAVRGHSQLSLGRQEDAAKSFEEALKRNPSYPPALLGQARLAVLSGDVAAAAGIVDKSISVDPSSLDAWLMKGDFERSTGNVEAAVGSYQKALALRPRGLAPNLSLATIYMESGQLDKAAQHVRTILQIAPESAAGNYIQGLLEYQRRNFSAANEAVQKVLAAVPSHLPATALAGMIALSLGNDDQAEKYLSEAVTRYPNSVYLRKALGSVLLKTAKVRAALEVLAPVAKAAADDSGLATLMAEARFRNDELAEARKYFEIASRQDPRSSKARTGLGLARLAAGDVERALADLESAVTLGSSNADAYLVRTLLSTKRLDKALEAVVRLEKERPTDPVTFNLKGAALFARGDVTGARKAFERAVELHPLHLAATINLAQLDTREGDVAAARKRFERILASDPNNAGAMLAMAELAIVSGKHPEAMQWAGKARQLQPKAFAASLLVAKLHFSQGDYSATVPVVTEALAANPESADALNMLAYSQLRIGHRAQALETYATLVRRKPNSAEAHYGLSGARLEDGQLAAAERSLLKALELRPVFPEAIQALVSLQLRTGKIADAGRLANDTRRRLPKSPLGPVLMGDVALAEKRYDAAIKAYQGAFDMEKSSVILVKLHGAMRDAGKSDAADALVAEWLSKHPNDTQVRYFVASAAARKQDFRLAAEQYQHILKSDPTNLAVHHNLVIAYEQAGDRRALAIAEAALKIAPKDPGALHDLGRLLTDAGKTDRAIEFLEQARVMVPHSDLLRYNLARAYAKAGNHDRATAELERLLRGRGEFSERSAAVALLKQLQN